jgi:hypothetical protein
MAVKKHRLQMAMQEDFCILGLMTDEPDYKLCWRINQAMDLYFEKLDDLKLYHRKLETDRFFSIFTYHDDASMLTYRIINNRSDRGRFLDELKNLDFIVHIQGALSEDKIRDFIKNTAALPGIRMCVPIDLNRIRDRERLMLW